jgi:hypothetical protein
MTVTDELMPRTGDQIYQQGRGDLTNVSAILLFLLFSSSCPNPASSLSVFSPSTRASP